MNHVAGQFALPGGFEFLRLFHRVVETDEQFPVQSVRSHRLQVIEGDDIRRAFMLEKRFVDSRHFRSADKMDAQFVFLHAKRFLQKPARDPAEQGSVNAADALAVLEDQGPVHWPADCPLPRCSS